MVDAGKSSVVVTWVRPIALSMDMLSARTIYPIPRQAMLRGTRSLPAPCERLFSPKVRGPVQGLGNQRPRSGRRWEESLVVGHDCFCKDGEADQESAATCKHHLPLRAVSWVSMISPCVLRQALMNPFCGELLGYGTKLKVVGSDTQVDHTSRRQVI